MSPYESTSTIFANIYFYFMVLILYFVLFLMDGIEYVVLCVVAQAKTAVDSELANVILFIPGSWDAFVSPLLAKQDDGLQSGLQLDYGSRSSGSATGSSAQDVNNDKDPPLLAADTPVEAIIQEPCPPMIIPLIIISPPPEPTTSLAAEAWVEFTDITQAALVNDAVPLTFNVTKEADKVKAEAVPIMVVTPPELPTTDVMPASTVSDLDAQVPNDIKHITNTATKEEVTDAAKIEVMMVIPTIVITPAGIIKEDGMAIDTSRPRKTVRFGIPVPVRKKIVFSRSLCVFKFKSSVYRKRAASRPMETVPVPVTFTTTPLIVPKDTPFAVDVIPTAIPFENRVPDVTKGAQVGVIPAIVAEVDVITEDIVEATDALLGIMKGVGTTPDLGSTSVTAEFSVVPPEETSLVVPVTGDGGVKVEDVGKLVPRLIITFTEEEECPSIGPTQDPISEGHLHPDWTPTVYHYEDVPSPSMTPTEKTEQQTPAVTSATVTPLHSPQLKGVNHIPLAPVLPHTYQVGHHVPVPLPSHVAPRVPITPRINDNILRVPPRLHRYGYAPPRIPTIHQSTPITNPQLSPIKIPNKATHRRHHAFREPAPTPIITSHWSTTIPLKPPVQMYPFNPTTPPLLLIPCPSKPKRVYLRDDYLRNYYSSDSLDRNFGYELPVPATTPTKQRFLSSYLGGVKGSARGVDVRTSASRLSADFTSVMSDKFTGRSGVFSYSDYLLPR